MQASLVTNENIKKDYIYKAFISYSHAADSKLAPVIQSAVQNFAKPWYKVRSYKVFRDETNLSVSPALWTSILNALAASEYFILFASPEAANSKWVRKEVDFWVLNRQIEKLLIVQTAGEIFWDEAESDFDWSSTTALPENLRKKFSVEPLYLDLRWVKGVDEQLSLRHSGFRQAVLKLVATLSGRDMSELDSKEVRQYKKNRRVAWLASIMLLVLTLLAVSAAYLFLQQKKEAEHQARIANSQRLAAQSQALLPTQLDLSMLLGVEAFKTEDTFESRNSILEALSAQPLLSAFLAGRNKIVSGPHFSPDGRRLIVVNDDGSISIWTTDTHAEQVESGKFISGDVFRSALSSDGKILVVGAGNTIYLWDLVNHRQLGNPIQAHSENISALAFSPDGRIIASAAQQENVVVFWDAGTQQQLGEPIKGVNDDINDIAFSPDGNLIAVAGETTNKFGAGGKRIAPNKTDNAVALFNVVTRNLAAPLLTGHKDSVECLAFNKKGDRIASGNYGGDIIVWEVKSNKPLMTLSGHHARVYSVAFSPAGEQLASSGAVDHAVYFWDLKTGKQIVSTLVAHTNDVTSVSFAPDGSLLASGANDWRVALWDLTVRHPAVRPFSGDPQSPFTVALSPDGKLVAAPADDNSIILWEMDSLKQLGPRLKAHEKIIRSIAFSPDGKTLAAGAADGFLSLWNVESKNLKMHPIKISDKEVWSLAFQPLTNLLACGDEEGSITLIDVTTGQQIKEKISGNVKGIFTLAFNPKGDLLVSGGADDTIKFWDISQNKQIGDAIKANQQYVKTLAFSPDGLLLASGGQDGSIKFLNPLNHELTGSALLRHTLQVSSLVFHPSGKMLISSSLDRSVIFWDLQRREPIGKPLMPHKSFVSALAIDGKGNMVSTGGFDNLLKWNTDIHYWIDRSLSIANRTFSKEERNLYLN